MDELIQRLMALFSGLENIHGTHGVPVLEGLKWAIKPTAKTIRAPATLELWIQHVNGERPLGIVPIRSDGTCTWGSIDVDKYGEDMKAIVERVERAGLPLVPCYSKSGGLHLFLFTDETVPAQLMQLALKSMAANLGLSGQEIFPKQTEILSERGDAGSWMIMPYYGDTFDGKLRNQVGVKRTGGEMLLEEFLLIAESKRVTLAELIEFGKVKPSNRPSAKSRRGDPSNDDPGDFSDGPRCLQIMYEGKLFKSPGRNNALFMMGVYLQRVFENGWEDRLREYNRLMMTPPMSHEEVEGTISSLSKKETHYTCKAEPMASYCDKAVCRGRRYGVGQYGTIPTISSLTKLDIEGNPIWFVDVGERRLEMKTDDLLNYQRFQKVCVDKLDIMYQPVKAVDWCTIVSVALESVTILEAPYDVGQMAVFRENLETFLSGRSRGERREDILVGMPWLDDEEHRHYFRLRDLIQFLEREVGMRQVDRGDIILYLDKLGGDTEEKFEVKGRLITVWWVPEEVSKPMPEVGAPPIRRNPI